MKTRLLIVLSVVVLLLLCVSVAAADAPSYWDAASQSNLYYEARYGIVICRQMNVRDRASTNGKSYGQIKTGQPVKILGISSDGNFYMLDLASCGFKSTGSATYGFAKSSLIKADPQFIASTKLTNLYATPWSTALKNGEQSGRFFLIIDQNYNWYAVQATESGVGTSFIMNSDIGNYSNYQTKYVVTWETQLLDENTWNQIQTLKRFSVGTLYSMNGDYTLLVFDEGQPTEIRGWVSNQYIAPIIN